MSPHTFEHNTMDYTLAHDHNVDERRGLWGPQRPIGQQPLRVGQIICPLGASVSSSFQWGNSICQALLSYAGRVNITLPSSLVPCCIWCAQNPPWLPVKQVSSLLYSISHTLHPKAFAPLPHIHSAQCPCMFTAVRARMTALWPASRDAYAAGPV